MNKKLDIRTIRRRLESSLRRGLKNKRRKLSLTALTVAGDRATASYIASQRKKAEELGIDYRLISFKRQTPLKVVLTKLRSLNRDRKTNGIIITRPFPASWDEFALCAHLDPRKDIEGLNPYNLGRILLGAPAFIPPTVRSVLEILKALKVNLYGKEVTVVGFSNILGKPLSILLADAFSTVTVTHIATYEKRNLPYHIKKAEVLITAVGKPHFIKGPWIKKGAIVIDVGMGKYKGVIAGDVEPHSAQKKASYITPVPKGVGSLTTLFLFDNLMKAARIQHG